MKFYKNIWIMGLASALALGVAHADDDMVGLLDASVEPVKKVSDPATLRARRTLQSIIGEKNGDVQIFLDRFFANDFKGALLTYNDAFERSSFKTSANGRALYGYLLARNGLRLKGLETLLAIENPKQVADPLIHLWQPLVEAQSLEWKTVEREVTVAWSERLDIPTLKVTTEKWQKAVQLGAAGDASKAAKILSEILASGEKAVNPDLMNITAARLLYQNGYLDAAIRYDMKVSRGSDYWYEAQEEAAWAYMRKGQLNEALAITKSLMHPDLALEVGPEAVFLHSLANLKVCNYPEVATALIQFKSRFRPKAANLQALLTESGASTIAQLLEVAKDKMLNTLAVGGLASKLPRQVGRDQIVAERGLRYGLLMKEAARAGELYSQSLQQGSQVGFQAAFEKIRSQLEARAQSTKAGFINRVQELARIEIKEISDMLQKMHIVEAELIQQTGMAERVAKDTKRDTANATTAKVSKKADEISFPGDKEIWFDELTHYKFDVNRGCQAKKTL